MRLRHRRIGPLLAVAAVLLSAGWASFSVDASRHHRPKRSHRPTRPHRPKRHHDPTLPAWSPLARQTYDAATTFLFDPAIARTQTPGNGGLMMGNAAGGDLPWQAYSKIAVVPGRYRFGVQSTNPRYGYLWMPVTGILSPRAFTIEFWAKSQLPFSALDGQTPVGVGGVSFQFFDRSVSAAFTQSDSYPPVNATVSASVSALPANTWENFALTYSKGALVLYVNGQAVARKSGVTPPQVWSDDNRGTGLTIGGFDGKGATGVAVSDLRISRIAKVPGRRPGAIPSTLQVSTTPTGNRIRQSLLGGLHTLTTPATVRMARGVIQVIRTDKLISSAPIKLGLPDAAHPSKGFSGIYSYNWAVVDRTMSYFKHLGVAPYLSVDSTPQLLGGSSPSLLGTLLNTKRSYVTGFNTQVPDSLHSWQLIDEDLAFHILNEDHTPVAYWSVWNEPDGAFWSGTLSQYLALYRATVDAVRTVDPHAAVGGAELASWDPQWVAALIAFCASQHLPLNFISWHYYSGDLGEIPEANSTVAALAAHYGIPRPFLNIGEWAWQTANLPGTGVLPFRRENYFLNDWSAAFLGASLIDMERNDVLASAYTNPVAARNASGYDASGLMSPSGPWANFNVYRLWHMLPPREVRTRLEADPGIFAVAAKDRHDLKVFVVSLHYQLGRGFALTLQLPRRLAGKTVRIWLIDGHHADAYDAGPRHAQLRARSTRLSSRAQLRLVLSPRAVVLVDVPLR